MSAQQSAFSGQRRIAAYDSLARLWLYPAETPREHLAGLKHLLSGHNDAAVEALAAFHSGTAALTTADLEELFIRAFDCNPPCAPEIGWHLFGEQYDRGTFMVWMRSQLRRFGLRESAELPDHVSHVLPVLARMDEAEAREFSTRCVQPALQRIREGIRESASPYRHVVDATAAVLESEFGPARTDRRLPVYQSEPTEAMLACGVCR